MAKITDFLKKIAPVQQRSGQSQVGYLVSNQALQDLCITGYTPLDKNPEIVAGCRAIADLISGMTIHLMSNTSKGDVRIENELSRKVDIYPISTMTRKHWMDAIVMNLLLYGKGNSVVWPHTWGGIIQSLEPIAASRVNFEQADKYNYRILIDGISHRPDDLLHFVFNPDKEQLWRGTGVNVVLQDVAQILAQAKHTEKSFMESKWLPSIIIKVDALTDEFSSPEGRNKLLQSYAMSSDKGEPWLIPAEAFSVEQVKPLTLGDLAINDTIQLDKRTVAAILGIPPFVLGVGEYNQQAWNNFIQNKIKPLVREIEQEFTRKILLNPKWYFRFNLLSLYDYDLRTIADVYGGLADRGLVTGNEVRDRIGMSPLDGLDELRILENYIPYDMSGNQKKLTQEGE